VIGVVASTPESTLAASAALHAERVFSSADELVASDDIDVVHVCTPNDLHLPLSEAAIAAGKHVVCEKPLATSLAGATRLLEAASAAGIVATVPFAYRFYPMVREARARVGDDAGPLRLIHGAYLQDWLSSECDTNWRVDSARGGPSRTFADIGSHWCDLVEFVSGDRIVSLSAELIRAIPERLTGASVHAFAPNDGNGGEMRPVDTEDAAIVTFRTERGVFGSMLVSQISTGRKNELRFELVGTDSTVSFEQERPDTLWVGHRASAEIVPRDAGTLHPSAARYVTVPVGHPQGYHECFDLFVADTYTAIAEGSTDAVDGLPTFADGVRAAQIIDAVLRSAAAHQWVGVDPAPATATPPAVPTGATTKDGSS
jgi:predicted dehydrogenase